MKNVLFIVGLLFFSSILFGQTPYNKLVNEGLTLLQQNDITMAMEKYRQALKIDSLKVEANYGLGVAYLCICQEQKHDCNNALYYLNKAIRINSNYRNAFYNRAKCKAYLNDFKGALQDFSYAIEKQPKDEENYFSRALIKIKLRDNKGACEDLYEAAQLGSIDAKKLFILNCGIK